MSKKTHCIRGHELVDGNVYRATSRGRPYRRCRACTLLANKLYDVFKRRSPKNRAWAERRAVRGAP